MATVSAKCYLRQGAIFLPLKRLTLRNGHALLLREIATPGFIPIIQKPSEKMGRALLWLKMDIF